MATNITKSLQFDFTEEVYTSPSIRESDIISNSKGITDGSGKRGEVITGVSLEGEDVIAVNDGVSWRYIKLKSYNEIKELEERLLELENEYRKLRRAREMKTAQNVYLYYQTVYGSSGTRIQSDTWGASATDHSTWGATFTASASGSIPERNFESNFNGEPDVGERNFICVIPAIREYQNPGWGGSHPSGYSDWFCPVEESPCDRTAIPFSSAAGSTVLVGFEDGMSGAGSFTGTYGVCQWHHHFNNASDAPYAPIRGLVIVKKGSF